MQNITTHSITKGRLEIRTSFDPDLSRSYQTQVDEFERVHTRVCLNVLAMLQTTPLPDLSPRSSPPRSYQVATDPDHGIMIVEGVMFTVMLSFGTRHLFTEDASRALKQYLDDSLVGLINLMGDGTRDQALAVAGNHDSDLDGHYPGEW